CIAVGPPTEPAAEQLLKRGWGFASVDYDAVQPDNGAGLVKGIIGLTNRGRPRKMDTWGVLRAWAWAINRTVDFLQTDPAINPHQIGVMGHSRDGKAALLALAYDPRIAVGYISSSGKGGADLYRRNYGENLGSLASSDEFQWFDGKFLRYASPGYTANELPVDSDELIALVAPRAYFIGAGSL
ncbi:acetyl xylan esterase, partial [mine drainage metagenome]